MKRNNHKSLVYSEDVAVAVAVLVFVSAIAAVADEIEEQLAASY